MKIVYSTNELSRTDTPKKQADIAHRDVAPATPKLRMRPELKKNREEGPKDISAPYPPGLGQNLSRTLSKSVGAKNAIAVQIAAARRATLQHPARIFEKEHYFKVAQKNLQVTSRTARGVVDTSASAEKAKFMVVASGEAAAEATQLGFRNALELIYDAKDRRFAGPLELRAFVENIARTVTAGVLKDGSLIRQHDSAKYGYTDTTRLNAAMNEFYVSFFDKLENDLDPIALAAWLEYRIDFTDHFFADGCGKTAKLMSAFALIRANFDLPRYIDRESYYAAAPSKTRVEDPNDHQLIHFEEYFRGLMGGGEPPRGRVQDLEMRLRRLVRKPHGNLLFLRDTALWLMRGLCAQALELQDVLGPLPSAQFEWTEGRVVMSRPDKGTFVVSGKNLHNVTALSEEQMLRMLRKLDSRKLTGFDRGAVLGASAGRIQSFQAFASKRIALGSTLKSEVEQSGSWTPMRRLHHNKFLTQAIQDARGFDDALRASDYGAALVALRGGTGAGKSYGLETLAALSQFKRLLNVYPNAVVSPDKFKPALSALTPGVHTTQTHVEASMLSRKLMRVCEHEGLSRVIDRRLVELADLKEIIESGERSNLPIHLFDFSYDLRSALVGVLARPTNADAPIVEFDSVLDSYFLAKRNRLRSIEMLSESAVSTNYQLFRREVSGDYTKVLSVVEGRIECEHGPAFEDSLSIDPVVVQRCVSQVIDEEFIEDSCAAIVGLSYQQQVRAGLSHYLGCSLKDAVRYHSRECVRAEEVAR